MSRQAIQDSVDVSVDAVADLSTLINDVRVANGTRVWVSGAGATQGLWLLNQSSAAAVDGLTVVATLSGVGRWIFFGAGGTGGGGNLAAPTEAGISAFGVSALRDGVVATQTTQIATYYLRTDAALVAVPHQILASPDPTRWWVRQTTIHQLWIAKWGTAGCFVATTGDDDAGLGTVGSPLQTWAEVRRRLGVGHDGKAQVANTQTLVVTVAAGTYPEILDLRGLSGAVDVVGAETTLASGVLNGYTNVNRASATGWAKLATAAFDFTPWLKNMFVITNGATAGARGWIESIPGANQAQITPASTLATRRSNPAIVVPAGVETFDVRQVATFFDSIAMDVVEDNLTSLTPLNTLWATFNSLGFVGAFGTSVLATGRTVFNDCRLDKKSDFATDLTFITVGCASIILNRCAVANMSSGPGTAGSTNLQTSVVYGGAGIGTLTSQNLAFTYGLGVDTLISDGAVSVGNGGRIFIGNCAFHNTIAARHAFNFAGASGTVRVDFQAGGNLYGSLLGANSNCFMLGVGTIVFANAVVPVLAPGAGGVAVKFGTVTKTFANLTPQGYFDFVAGAQTGALEQGSMWLP